MKLDKKDTWLVLSPGRTGSKLLVDIIRSVYNQNEIKIRYTGPRGLVTFYNEYGSVIHSHKLEYYSRYHHNCTKTVISCRDMVKSAISWVTQKQIGKWHLYNHDKLFIESRRSVVKFDYEMFVEKYNYTKRWYETIKQQLDGEELIIHYDEMNVNTDLLLNELGLKENLISDRFRLPIKNPGTPRDWFYDWDEVVDKISTLETVPPL